ncbi:MAG: pH regulation protein F [Solirubrobacterales bacterium]|jgi:multisubunit Na+/H+ antiporter MnhF subunit|nr:pH regulation protein F [Solirubrobacterales bacterium]
MHQTVFYFAAIWMTVLLGVSVLQVVRARHAPSRIVALDMLVLILIAQLVLFSDARSSSHYLDAALLLAVLSFISTLAAARYHALGRVF